VKDLSAASWRAAIMAAFALVLSGCVPPAASTNGSASMSITTSPASTESNTTAVEDTSGVGFDDAGMPAQVQVPGPDAGPPPRQRPLRKLDPDELEIITFDDLKIDMQADQVFDPSMLTDRVRQLDGQRVRIRGFIFPAIFQQDDIKEFPLVMNTQCKFGPGGQAHCIILIQLVEGLTTSFTVRPIAVQGRLKLQPWTGPDGNTWSLYYMVGEKID